MSHTIHQKQKHYKLFSTSSSKSSSNPYPSYSLAISLATKSQKSFPTILINLEITEPTHFHHYLDLVRFFLELKRYKCTFLTSIGAP